MSKMIKIIEKSDRYLMPMMQIRGEGRGNGVRTVIENLGDIAKALHRNPDHLTRFFGFELGSMARYDEKRGYATINGTHTIRDLSEALTSFINRYLVCPNCGLPELVFKYPAPGKCVVNCSSCGHSSPLDMSHQISSIIARGNATVKSTIVKKHKRDQMKNPATRIMQALAKAEEEMGEGNPLTDEKVGKRIEVIRTTIGQLQTDGYLQMGEEVPAVVAAIADSDIIKNWKIIAPILKDMVGKDQTQQMYVLYSIELLIMKYEVLKPELTNILFNLHESDIISDTVFTAWASDGAEPFVQPHEHQANVTSVETFLAWLEGDGEEEEEEEEFEEEAQ